MNQIIDVTQDNRGIKKVVHAVQNDSGRVLKLSVSDRTDLASTMTYNLVAEKPSGLSCYIPATYNATDNVVSVALTNQLLAEVGNVKAQLEITDTAGKVTAYYFYICVEEALRDDSTIESSNEFTALQSMINNVTTVKSEFDSAISAVSTSTELTDIRVKADGTTATTAGNAVREQISAINGDLAQLSQTNKSVNLYDNSKRTIGKCLDASGQASSTGAYDTSDYISVEYGKEYKLGCYNGTSLATNAYTCRFIAEYDGNKTFISPIINGNNLSSGIYTPRTSSVKFIRFSASNNRAYECHLYDIFAISSNFPTAYTPYFDEIKIKDSALSATMQGLPDRVTALEDAPSPTPTERKTVVYWGDSLTQGDQDGTGVTRASVMSTLLGTEWTVKNFGAGGEQSNTIACRQGGLNLVVKPNQTIPSSGSVNLEIVDNDENAVNLRSSTQSTVECYNSLNPCYINGIKGTLTNGTSFGASPYKFTRETSGNAVTIDRPTTVITNAMLNYVGNIAIIEVGQNGGYDSNADTLVRQIKQMIDINQCDKYLVCGFCTAGKTAQNTALKNAFGRHFIDVMKYASTPIYENDGVTIISSYGLADMNLTMTSTDLERINDGLMPKSLQIESDNIHLNQYGYTMQAYLEYKRGKELGYWE